MEWSGVTLIQLGFKTSGAELASCPSGREPGASLSYIVLGNVLFRGLRKPLEIRFDGVLFTALTS